MSKRKWWIIVGSLCLLGLLVVGGVWFTRIRSVERVIPVAPGREIRVFPGSTVGSAFYVRGHLCAPELTHEECKALYP